MRCVGRDWSLNGQTNRTRFCRLLPTKKGQRAAQGLNRYEAINPKRTSPRRRQFCHRGEAEASGNKRDVLIRVGILRGAAAPGDRSNRRNGLGVETLNLLNIEMIYIGI